jgi:protein gp37
MTTGIGWTNKTWNPLGGCNLASPGCTNCYAMRDAWRLSNNPLTAHDYQGLVKKVKNKPVWTGVVRLFEDRLEQPLHLRKPRMIFVNSMSDLFHEDVKREWIDRIFDTMEKADWHIFQVLTKRSERMRDYLNKRYKDKQPPKHIWCGVSVEDQQRTYRIRHLRDARAGLRFLSLEPLLESLGSLNLKGIGWVIAGGESGPRRRVCQPDWIREIRDQCFDADIAFYFKQWGGITSKANGCELDGRLHKNWPTTLA